MWIWFRLHGESGVTLGGIARAGVEMGSARLRHDAVDSEKETTKQKKMKDEGRLVPINGNTAGSRGSDPDASVSFTFEPFESTFVIFKVRL